MSKNAFGIPVSEIRTPTLNIVARYSDTTVVQYNSGGDTRAVLTYRRRDAFANSPKSFEAIQYFESRLLFLLSLNCLRQNFDATSAVKFLNSSRDFVW
jgi:hypothetical protein